MAFPSAEHFICAPGSIRKGINSPWRRFSFPKCLQHQEVAPCSSERAVSRVSVCLQDQLLVPPWWLSGGDCRETTAHRFVFALGRDRGRIGNVIKYGNQEQRVAAKIKISSLVSLLPLPALQHIKHAETTFNNAWGPFLKRVQAAHAQM